MDGSGLPETRSTCPYCGVGCGVLLRPDGEGGLSVRGDPDHPANLGRLCSKGSALGETVGLSERLLFPMIKGQPAGWDQALDLVAERFKSTIEDHGPDSAAFYVSGQLLTEDYYVANKLMKGFIGSANIDTNSRLCMASTVAGHKRAFGTDTVPGTYEDLDEADLVVLVGANLAWCHPVLYQRVIDARQKRGTRIVVIDPRRTASCDQADAHLALEPGSDVALFNYLLTRLYEGGALDKAFLQHVSGFDRTLRAAYADDVSVTGLSRDEIDAFCSMWMRYEKVVTVFSQGVNQSTSGTDKVNSILNCHLATGRIGNAGSGPLSVTGQPNAMGGREVGGLANTLTCHLELENAGHRAAVQQFWGTEALPQSAGLKAVDMFNAVAKGQIKALWIIHTNPAVSMPQAGAVAEAIASCEFSVVSDITMHCDTAQLADVVLPATAWAEKNGTVTNSDRTISRQRAVLNPPGDVRDDWKILSQVAQRMGFGQAFDYKTSADIFREYATLSGIAAHFGADFDISNLRDIQDHEWEKLSPVRWPISATRTGGRFFGDGKFYHKDGKARMVPIRWRPPAVATSSRYPFRLNTGRIRDQWHTMTRTALSPRLSAHLAEPYVDLHPEDAAKLDVGPAALISLTSPHGSAILRARISDAQKPGQLFAPMHWTAQTAPAARIDKLVAPHTDPVSGQPESKASVVAAERFDATWYGFAISTGEIFPQSAYWARARTQSGWRAELAGSADIAEWEAEARRLFALPNAKLQLMEDVKQGAFRLAFFEDDRLCAALFVSQEPVAVMRDYLVSQTGAAGQNILSGSAGSNFLNPGPVVCACLGIGINTILAAIETDGLASIDAIGDALGAGMNCGACRPELGALLAGQTVKQAAE